MMNLEITYLLKIYHTVNSFDKVMKGNRFIIIICYFTRAAIADYCQRIFPTLFELEKRVDLKGYDPYQQRIYGFLTERLFDVWMNIQYLKIKECELKIIGRRLNIICGHLNAGLQDFVYKNIYIGLIHKSKKR